MRTGAPGQGSLSGPVALRLIYVGGPPVHWTGGPGCFGMQDREGRLTPPMPLPTGEACFDFAADVHLGSGGLVDFAGSFVHGPRGGRFIYLAWRNQDGPYAQRFKLPLESITAAMVAGALAERRPISATLVVAEQRATRAGSNIGGTRTVDWF